MNRPLITNAFSERYDPIHIGQYGNWLFTEEKFLEGLIIKSSDFIDEQDILPSHRYLQFIIETARKTLSIIKEKKQV